MKNPFTEHFRLVRAIERAKREGRTDEFIQAAKENAKLQKLVMQPKRYETINGSGEIGWGTAILCFAFSSYSAVILPNSMGKWRAGIGGLLLVCACMAMPLCLWASKRFVTWPRVGYVAYRRDRNFWTMMVVTMVVAAGVSLGLSLLMRHDIIQMAQSQAHHSVATTPGTPSHASKIMPTVFIVSNAIMYLMINAVSIREHRWKWLLLVLLVLGATGICFLARGNYTELFRPLGLFLGLIWFISGAITLVSFINHHQPPAPETE